MDERLFPGLTHACDSHRHCIPRHGGVLVRFRTTRLSFSYQAYQEELLPTWTRSERSASSVHGAALP